MPSDISTLASAMRNFAATFPSITNLLGQEADGTPWITVDDVYSRVENTRTSAIVISENNTWTSPNMHNTMQFPRLIVNIISDPTRDPATNYVITPDAKVKAKAVYDAFNAIFHDPARRYQNWDGVRVLDSQLRNGPTFLPYRDGQDMANIQLIYGVTLG